MATITGFKRLTTLGKGLVHLSSGLCEKSEYGAEAKTIGLLTVGTIGAIAYYGSQWMLPSNGKLKEILLGNQDDIMIEDTLIEQYPENLERLDVPAKRRVRNGRKAPFMREVLSACKNRFGTPLNNTANRRVVRRFMLDYMRSHDVRNASIRMFLPNLVESMFVPDKYEIEAMQLANCPLAHARKVEYGLLQSALNISQL